MHSQMIPQVRNAVHEGGGFALVAPSLVLEAENPFVTSDEV
jgi:hypothetical protein